MGLFSNFRQKFHNAFFTQVLYGTVASLAIFLTSFDHLDRMRDRYQSKLRNDTDTDTFDFIVVGGGVAGSVVANKLSEFYSVLLLEFGGEPHPFQACPSMAFFMPNHPEVDWMHRSVPQKRAFGLSQNREASLSQGKNLGGSGNLNFLNYLRGSPLDYEHWANITEDTSWGYREMRKYFQMIEDYSKEPSTNAGAVKIDIPDFVGLSAEFIAAGQQHDYKHVDLNENFTEGFDVNYYPIYKGVRQGPYQSYIKTARGRKSLTIRKFAHVNKILFRDDTTQAYGVEYTRHGEVKIAKATKEIILSAGALGTPKLLMTSGVGPAEHLQDIGIPVRLDLPVGRNLQDHISTLVGPFFIKEPRGLLLGKDIDTRSFLEWGMDGKGPLTSSFFQASGLILSSFAKSREEDSNWPDIHLQLSSIGVHKTYAQDLAHAYNLQENVLSQYYSHAVSRPSFSVSVTNGRPVARGEILLSGRDPKDKLLINPRYLEDPYGVDVNIMKDGINAVMRLVENSTSFQKLGARFTEKSLPPCSHVEFRSSAYFECYIRQLSLSMHAYCGTAPMGKVSSKFSVVDPELKVIGAKGLRVIDASVMPTIVAGSPQAAVLAIGEKGADNILRYWRQFDVPPKKPVQRAPGKLEGNDTGKDDVTDSFSGFSFAGKVTRIQNGNRGKTNNHVGNRKHPKQKIKTSGGSTKRPNNERIVSTSSTTVRTTTRSTTTASTQKPDFDQAETRFSHNLNQIMEFLRNSRAINEAIDDETYNDLVQNFGERIVEFMKKNKTDIFFVPITTTSTTTTTKPLTIPTSTKTTTTTRRPQSPPSTTSRPPSKNSFGGFVNSNSYSKISFGKSSDENSSPKNTKQYEPFQFSTTSNPVPAKVTTVVRKLSTYFLNSQASPKPKPTTPTPKKGHHYNTPSAVNSGKVAQGTKFSSVISNIAHVNKPSSIVTVGPKKITSPAYTTSFRPLTSSSTTSGASSILDSLFNNSDSDEGEFEETTSFDDEEVTTQAPTEYQTTTKPPTKYVELILNPDLTVNKTKEYDGPASIITSSGKHGEKDRELIEYRTEEVRPFPHFPPYKIVNVPGQEFNAHGGILPPSFTQSHSITPAVLLQPSPSGITSLTPPPPHHHQQGIRNHFHHRPISQPLPPPLPLPQFHQAHILSPPKPPTVVDENLPIQTAKTVLYYTQVFPRDLDEIRNRNVNINNNNVNSNVGQIVPSSLSLSSSSVHKDPSQSIVQFLPSVH